MQPHRRISITTTVGPAGSARPASEKQTRQNSNRELGHDSLLWANRTAIPKPLARTFPRGRLRDVRWLLLTLALSVGGACWTGPVADPTPANSSTEAPPRRVRYSFDSLTLERTSCLGACPAYTVTVFSNGAVRWVGEANVASMGMRTGRISRGQIELVERKLDAIDFFDYDESGVKKSTPQCVTTRSGGMTTMTCNTMISICTDVSRGIITFVRGRKQHRVEVAHCDRIREAPLIELEQLIDEVAGTRDWVGG
ncbi:MAG: DUF6438 domain-containing protein [Kofleriaceae bacterium]